jgi:DNA-binding CsgD family transcriptional regulator
MSGTDTRASSYAAALESLAQHGLDACELDDRTPVHEALAQIPPSVRQRDPACIAVQAALERFEGRVDAAVTLYQRALRMEMNPRLEVRIRENLGHLFVARRQNQEAAEVVERARALAPHDPRIVSLDLVLRARSRDARVLDDLAALETSMADLSDLEKARIYRRLSSAAYEAGGALSMAERYIHLVIEHAEAAAAHCHATMAYQNLEQLYSNVLCDSNTALKYNELWVNAALKAGDQSSVIYGLAGRYDLATETGDKVLKDSVRRQLRDLEGPERYIERIGIVVGDAMGYGWSGDFERMRQYLRSVNIGRTTNAQKSLYESLLAVAEMGTGRESEALKAARRGVSLGRPLANEPPGDTRSRLLARLVGAHVILGRNRTEALRALKGYESQMTASLLCLRDAILDRSYDAVRERAPDVYGYALLCEALDRKLESPVRESAVELTQREIGILRAVSRGSTSRAIAEEMKIGIRTVEWHRNNALKKLGVKTTIAAIFKARELQIIP